MPQYAIIRFAKHKGGAGALEAHYERTKDKYASKSGKRTTSEKGARRAETTRSAPFLVFYIISSIQSKNPNASPITFMSIGVVFGLLARGTPKRI